MTVLETAGKVDGSIYGLRDWHERDNFLTIENARGYARALSKMHRATPYRIVTKRKRFAVQYVPEWRLR